ncbi:hypothetical protein [Rudanella lutea]|uniref:hypothetical protein n=1 Tax=Rudanella lutea TaxID=451374 RepID=UPI00036F8E61|nr:hypothetical protein [Rudanella lutea]
MPFPAPARFTDLRAHLHAARIDAAHLSFVLEHYLSLPQNMPLDEWYQDPLEDHQAWAYRDIVSSFRQMIEAKPDEGNGEEPEDDTNVLP